MRQFDSVYQLFNGLIESNVMNFGLTNPDWDKFRGNNREKIELPDVCCGGSVDVASYIGKPLSKELWIDLVHRLMISGLCVYSCGDGQKLVGCGDGHCIINLDEFDNVERIYFYPHRSILYDMKDKLKKSEEDRMKAWDKIF